MKVRSEQLSEHLKSTLSPIYLISGDEPLTKLECCDRIRATAKANGYTEREVLKINGQFKWEKLYSAAHSLSLFAEKTILELHFETNNLGREGSQALVNYCENLPDDKLVLIIAEKLDAAKQKTKWHKAIDSKGITIQVWPVSSQQMPRWLTERLQQNELSVDQASLQILCERVEGNLLAAKQEIEKLRLLYGPGQLNYEQVTAAIGNHSRYTVFQLVDAALSGQHTRSLNIIRGLRDEGIEPILVLWALSRELRLLCAISFASSQQQPIDLVFREHRVWKQRESLVNQASRRYHVQQWQALLSQSRYIDEIIKGARAGSVWQALSDLSLKIGGLNLMKSV